MNNLKLINEAIYLIQKDPFQGEYVPVFQKIISGFLGEDFIVGLHQNLTQNQFPPTFPVFGRMQRLFEVLAENNEACGCSLMLHLWDMAGREIGEHEVCDGIDFWIHGCNASDFISYLNILAKSSPNLLLARKCKDLLKDKQHGSS